MTNTNDTITATARQIIEDGTGVRHGCVNGTTTVQIAKALGLSTPVTRRLLKSIEKTGAIECRGFNLLHWLDSAKAAALRAEMKVS